MRVTAGQRYSDVTAALVEDYFASLNIPITPWQAVVVRHAYDRAPIRTTAYVGKPVREIGPSAIG